MSDNERPTRRADRPEAGSNNGNGTRGRRSRGPRPRRGRRQWHGYTPAQIESRRAAVPVITYPEELPVSARREEIAAAIRENQVVIVAGETGSGKTTQLPKICLELGRGITGMIGHTQPRRIAARSVAERIAYELSTRIGPDGVVGYQVRFTEETGPGTLVKLMTDGILLAEIQSDPLLRRYDTIIVDEAHERSLNIDFILGYLARLLPQRPDLKVIITSATIDSERFAAHFGQTAPTAQDAPLAGGGHDALAEHGDTTTQSRPTRVPAPVIEVSGRTYPVEIRYRPLVLDPTDPDDPDADASGVQDSSPAARGRQGTGAAQPAPETDRDQVTGILDAVDELMAAGSGDILVFLAGERDIRDTESALIDHLGPRYTPHGRTSTPGAVEVVPLFSRLSAAEQHRVFEAHTCRRIVLATNVAETSLTVPGIRYVVDPGLARISRYSNRTKVQRLPIEPISRASANQRSGRCGRVADGIAIRLYSQSDFESRPEYTEPEILRTSLASVILQMAALGLGDVQDFPFLDAPDARAVRDGIQLLGEIGAIETSGREGSGRRRGGRGDGVRGPRLTEVGRRLARLPIDPRLGRMLLEAGERGCVSEVMVIVAALSMQDVRERPADHQEAADALHRRFAEPTSDFLTYLNLWRYLRTQQRDLSGSAFRRMCRSEFLHYLRVREWQDVYNQLRQLARPLGLAAAPVDLPTASAVRAAAAGLEPGTQAATIAHGDVAAAVVALGRSADTPSADAIHRSLLVGLLSNVGTWDERRREYAGTRGSHFVIWPGSGLRRKTYDWVMTAELVETSRLFARTVAKVDARWIEEAAGAAGLLHRVYGEPYWSTRRGAAMVHEKLLLYGMTLVADRPATLASVGTADARELAREMFIRSGLVEGGWHARHGFVERNRALLEELADVEQRRREHGLLAGDEALFDFYDDRLPDDVYGANDFDAWWKRERRNHPDLFDFTRELLLPGGDDTAGYPDAWVQGDLTLGLEYVFEPGTPNDGVSVLVPVEVLGRLEPTGFDWLVPGLRPELVVATIRALPKRVRRALVPAPDVGAQMWEEIRRDVPGAAGGAGAPSAPGVPFREAFTDAVGRLRQVEITEADWEEAAARLPDHLRIAFVAVDGAGRELDRDKDLVVLQRRQAGRTEAAVRDAVHGAIAQAMADAQRSQGRRRGGRGRRRGQGGGPDAGAFASRNAGGNAAPAANDKGTRAVGPGLAERAGLTDWPKDVTGLEGPEHSTIPATIETPGTAGLVVRGYPALVAVGARGADLRILPDAVAQERAHGAGVTALTLARTALPTARITSRWNPTETLTLAASPYRSTEALVEDMQLTAARSIADRWAAARRTPLAGVREQTVFEQLVATMRQELEDEVYRVAQVSAKTLAAQREVEREVSTHTSLALLNTLQQVREHAAALVYDGFIADTPPEQLRHLPRYLQALAMRVGKAESSPSQDAALAYQVEQAERLLADARARAAALPTDPEREAVLVEARWLIEELRVSLFAQTLGTARKVSVQRISKLLAKV
ncbi:ATP-dependent RNA helicase HrpA [Actinomyces sp. Z5]|uniref:ATP-dependent RNA helicase HrpA n=1 Tax=Actinomyces sp. Z5 TaxID=2250216 RepID=UPI000DCD4E57|nr:ATP-dependent RNA helicase HrpA [Actinomyces sp. Z5]RAX24104.1 ATP-dependent RNA helicase HrpA [Actinomyces sp. Z5]